MKGVKRMNPPKTSEHISVPKDFRRLQANELVSVGDFVADEQRGFEPWEGPNGFRADSFVRAIYRRNNGNPTAMKRSR
jgi:hypothetical protein